MKLQRNKNIKKINVETQCITSLQKRFGFTLLEYLVAVAISLIFLGSLVTVYIQIEKSVKISNARMEAYQNARAALDFLTNEIKDARPNFFLLIDKNLSYGDRIDNDGDGRIDEELADGLDNDGDRVEGKDDRDYRFLNGATEYGYGIPDLGDDRVDEDVKYSRDELTFRVASPVGVSFDINYRIALFQDENDVLLRTINSTPPIIGPIAFDVLSFNILAWNNNPLNPGWVTSLNGDAPTSIYAEITVQPDYPGLEPITVHTIINLELVM